MKTRFNPFNGAGENVGMRESEKPIRPPAHSPTSTSPDPVPIIVAGFTAKGIAAVDIKPRENVLMFQGWLAKRRSVKKGEHGVRVPVGKGKRFYTVFHESQTEAVGKDRENARQGEREKKELAAPVKTVVPVDFKPAQEMPVAVTAKPELVVYPLWLRR
jgi:hypothetical protein